MSMGLGVACSAELSYPVSSPRTPQAPPTPAPCTQAQRSPSLSMPTRRHLVKRQAWQALRLLLVISHSLEAGQLYSMLPARKRQGSSGGLPGPGGGPEDGRALTRPGLSAGLGRGGAR